MMNVFDSIRDHAIDIVTHTMGYNATWAPTGGGPVQTAEVLYTDATDENELGDNDYSLFNYRMQYRVPTFAALGDLANMNSKETIAIDLPAGTVSFIVKKVKTKFDGVTCIAYMEKV